MRRNRVFSIIQIGHRDDIPSKVFDYFIVVVITLNILVLFLSTFEQFADYRDVFDIIETATIGVFIVEYILRIWTADQLYPGMSRGRAILRFVFSFDGIVMLFSILPFYFLSGFVLFRMVRVIRVFHLFRLNASYDSFNVITRVLYEKRSQLLSSILVILILILGSALCMYSVEHEAQPGVFKNAFSGVWWSLSTIFTVGYGDIYPITWLGRAMTVIITILGVLGVAIPTGIISAGFVEYDARMRAESAPASPQRNSAGYILEADASMIGDSVKVLEHERQLIVTAIVREKMVLLPSDDLKIRAQDILICQMAEEEKV